MRGRGHLGQGARAARRSRRAPGRCRSRARRTVTAAVSKRSCSISSPAQGVGDARTSRLDHDVEVGARLAQQQVAHGAADQVGRHAGAGLARSIAMPGQGLEALGELRGVDLGGLRPLCRLSYHSPLAHGLLGREARMQKLQGTAKNLWENHRIATLAGAIAIVVAACRRGRLPRAASVPTTSPTRTPSSTQADSEKAIVGVANWPIYGLNNERTRYLAGRRTRSPRSRSSGGSTAASCSSTRRSSSTASLYAINNNGEAFSVKTRNGKIRWRSEIASLNASSPAYSDGQLYRRQPRARPGPGAERQERRPALEARAARPHRVLAGRRRRQGDRRLRVRDALRVRRDDRQDRVGDRPAAARSRPRPRSATASPTSATTAARSAPVNIDDGSIKWQSAPRAASFGRPGTSTRPPRSPSAGSTSAARTAASTASRRRPATSPGARRSAASVYAGAVAADTPNTDPTVYFGSYDGRPSTRSTPQDGDERWSADAGGAVIGAASLIGETVYVANLDTTETSGVQRRHRREGLDASATAPTTRSSPTASRIYLTGQQADLRAEAGPAAEAEEAARAGKKGKKKQRQEEVGSGEPDRDPGLAHPLLRLGDRVLRRSGRSRRRAPRRRGRR